MSTNLSVETGKRMKNTLTVAIMCVSSCGFAEAQEAAAVSSVRIYGIADAALSYQTRLISTTGVRIPGSAKDVNSSSNTGSRLGFIGREDLGDGLSAIFLLEQGVQIDTGALSQGGRGFGRQSFVGLEGKWGRLTAGRQYSPFFELQSYTDAFANNLVGNIANLEQSDSRVDNAIIYASPAIAGLRAQVLVAPSEGTTAGRQLNVAATYSQNGLYLAATSLAVKNGATGRANLVGGSYDLKFLQVFGNYVRLSNMKGLTDSTTPSPTAAPVVQQGANSDAWGVGLRVPAGLGRFVASYTSLQDKRALNQNAQMYAVAYEYYLSKRTSLYTGGARIVNHNGGAMVVSTPSVLGQGEQQFTLGITHRF